MLLLVFPREILEAALALCATRWEALTDIILPAAKSGIWASILLSLGRQLVKQ
jgi:phosphate transport system permease protein